MPEHPPILVPAPADLTRFYSGIFRTAFDTPWCLRAARLVELVEDIATGETTDLVFCADLSYEDGSDWTYVDQSKVHTAFQALLNGKVQVNRELRRRILSAYFDEVSEPGLGCLDAEEADVVLQVAAFGSIVYG